MLVEDEYLLNKAIKSYLVSKKFTVDGFTDGLEALSKITNGYDLFILDIDIPHISGIELLEEIRKVYKFTPIIIISATIDMNIITEAYTKGCNDYLKKPFDIKELALKILAHTRDVQEIILLGQGLRYDKNRDILLDDEDEISLTVKEQLFISILLQNRGTIVTHEHLEVAIWGVDEGVPHLRQLVSRLRKKLPFELIENRVGEGYIINGGGRNNLI